MDKASNTRKKRATASEERLGDLLRACREHAVGNRDDGQDGEVDLAVEIDESVTLSPTSTRYASAYRTLTPRGIEEVRDLLGIVPAVDQRMRDLGAGGCGCGGGKGSYRGRTTPVHKPEDLRSEDESVRAAALRDAKVGAHRYLRGEQVSPAQMAYLDAYIAISKAKVSMALFQNITVQDGATLTVSASTHALYANKIVMYGSGRIVCSGPTTVRCASMAGFQSKPALQLNKDALLANFHPVHSLW